MCDDEISCSDSLFDLAAALVLVYITSLLFLGITPKPISRIWNIQRFLFVKIETLKRPRSNTKKQDKKDLVDQLRRPIAESQSLLQVLWFPPCIRWFPPTGIVDRVHG